MQNLVEKQRIFAALYETVMEQETPHKGLLLRGDSSDLQQGEMLLKGAIYEGTSSDHVSLLWLIVCHSEDHSFLLVLRGS